MDKIKGVARFLGFGLVCWALPFVAAVPLFRLIGDRRVFYKGAVDLFLFAGALVAWRGYARKLPDRKARTAAAAGAGWLALVLGLDSLVMLGWFGMDAGTYLAEIGLSYLAIPMATLLSAAGRGQSATPPGATERA